MGFVRDRRQRVTAEFLRNNHSGADLFRTGGRSCANASAGSFRMAGAGCPDIERHGIMDTAEYTFTVGGSIFFPAICPRVRRSWLCGDASRTGQQVGPCWKPPRATDGIISASFRYRMHTGFAGRHHAANTCGSCDAIPRPVSGAGFRIPFLQNCCLTGNRLYLTDDWAGTVLSAGDAGASSQPPPRAL